MSPLFQMKQPHKPFVCLACRRRWGGDLGPMRPGGRKVRLLRVYPLVKASTGELAAMRSPPRDIMVLAPMDSAEWGFGHRAPGLLDNIELARPDSRAISEHHIPVYNDRESHNIWLHAAHVQSP